MWYLSSDSLASMIAMKNSKLLSEIQFFFYFLLLSTSNFQKLYETAILRFIELRLFILLGSAGSIPRISTALLIL